jgi:hypothetical protein
VSGRRAAWCAFVAALLVHLPALRGGFVYDDHRFVEANPAVRKIGNPLRFLTDLDTTADPAAATRDVYRPLRTFVYALSVSLFGPVPAPLHALSLLLHASTAALLVRLLLAARLAPWPSLGAALLFALHPVTVEATAWISSLGDLLCACFTLLATLCFARGRHALAVAALAPALLGKEHAVVAPALWAAWAIALERKGARRAIARGVVPGALLVAAFLAWRFELTGRFAQTEEPLGGSAAASAFTMLSGLGFYAACVLFPSGPTFDARVAVHDRPALGPAIGAVVLLTLFAGATLGRGRLRLGSLWFLAAFMPVSNVLVPLKIPTADRFLYLPLMGLAFPLGGALARAEWRRVTVRAAPAVLALLSALTVARIRDWRDDDALIDARDRVDPKSLAGTWAKADRSARWMEEALAADRLALADAHFRDAVRHYATYLDPRNSDPAQAVQVHVRFGSVLERWGQVEMRHGEERNALEMYTRALEQYRAAHALHRRGIGRRVDAEVLAAADGIVRLSIQLALPENPDFVRVFEAGWEAAKFLEAEFGRDETVRGAQLLLARGAYLARLDGKLARESLEAALEAFGRAGSHPYETANGLLLLGSLPGSPRDLDRLSRAHDLFLEVARDRPELRGHALLGAARARCRAAEAGAGPEALAEARRLLDAAAKAAGAPRLRREIEAERKTCGGGG